LEVAIRSERNHVARLPQSISGKQAATTFVFLARGIAMLKALVKRKQTAQPKQTGPAANGNGAAAAGLPARLPASKAKLASP
jgi:hypothetical protein